MLKNESRFFSFKYDIYCIFEQIIVKMKDSKLVQLFETLDSPLRAKLRKFLQSPYHNRREDVLRLFEFLLKQGKDGHWDKKKAWTFCYPNLSQYHDGDMRCLMTFLLKCIEAFLIAEQLQQDNAQQELYLSQAYHALQLPQQAQQHLEKLGIYLDKQPTRNSDYLRQYFEIQQAQHYFTEDLHRDAPRNLQLWADTLEHQFIAEKLKQTCELLAHQTVYKIEYDLGMLPMLIQYVQSKETILLQQPAIALYYYYYQASTVFNTQESEMYFKLYIDALLQSTYYFPQKELKALYTMALNYAIRKVNVSYNQYYMEQLFMLYKSGLEHAILLENNQLSRFAYKNIVGVALQLEQYDWVKQFIAHYTTLLPKLYQKSYESYVQGKLYFAQRNYTKALEHLQYVEYEDIFLNLGARVMQLKIYYELGEYMVLDSFLQSFKVFVLRKKRVLGYHYDNFKNIIQLVRRLMNLPFQSKKKKAKLYNTILQMDTLTEKEWLLKQLEK